MKYAHPFPKEEAGALDSVNSKPLQLRSPRQRRVLTALLQSPGWISRESIDGIAGASNGPQIILSLRRGPIGHDGIEMERRDATDRDGLACRPGSYRLTQRGRERAALVLEVSV